MSKTTDGSGFLNMEFSAEVWLAAESVPLGTLLDLQPGEVLSLSKDPEAAVDLVINGTKVASGELVVVEGKFGLRVTDAASNELAGLADEEGESCS